jgi:uncharacterized protein YbaR (Trm112 family)
MTQPVLSTEILQCPVTSLPLGRVTDALFSDLRRLAETGELRTESGELLPAPVTGAYLRADGKLAYVAINGIPFLLPGSGIPV